MRNGLPRRVYLGLEVSRAAFVPEGLRISGVRPSSTGAAAGLLPSDVLVSVNGESPTDASALRRMARSSSPELSFQVIRQGKRIELASSSIRLPLEELAGNVVSYAEVDVGCGRLRSIMTRPNQERAGSSVVVAYLQGISAESVDFALHPRHPIAAFLSDLAQAGFSTFRFEKRGVGDSDGESLADFDTDVADARAAVRELSARDDVEHVILFGHSIGGMIAPYLFDLPKVRGVAVYGSSSARWSECRREGARRQYRLRGIPEANQAALVAEHLADLAGRSPDFHDQLEATDLATAWSMVNSPVLSIHGEYDWVVGADEARQLAERAPSGVFAALSSLDHSFTTHASLAESLARLGKGVPDPRLAAELALWIRRVALR